MTEKALLVYTVMKKPVRTKPEAGRPDTSFSAEEVKQEFIRLVESAGCEVVEVVEAHLARLSAALYIGSGKADEIAAAVAENAAEVVVFSQPLSPAQQRNLEDIIGKKVIDRIQLILDIFARHAHSSEGQLQVELAQLRYLLPRLKGKGIMLSRLGGGVGTRGPGEKILEIERRRITDRVTMLERELKNMDVHRDTMRKKKVHTGIPTISLIGYTSVGKSTLMNAVTAAQQTVASSYFTTLDTISRVLEFRSGHKAVMTDTVGFMHDLPPYLIESFKTTLRELKFASVLVHVVDASSQYAFAQIEAVHSILKELDVLDKPQLMVFNKIDLCQTETQTERRPDEEFIDVGNKDTMDRLQQEYPDGMFVSALNNSHLDALLLRIESMIFSRQIQALITLGQKDASLFHHIHAYAKVENIDYQKDSVIFSVVAEDVPFEKLKKVLDKKAAIQIIR